MSCAKAFNNLSAEQAFRTEIIKDGGVAALGNLSQVVDKQVRQECAQALANLSSEKNIENDMIVEGAAQVMLDIVKTSGSYTKEYCLLGLKNLSAVETKYVRIGEINEGILVSVGAG